MRQLTNTQKHLKKPGFHENKYNQRNSCGHSKAYCLCQQIFCDGGISEMASIKNKL